MIDRSEAARPLLALGEWLVRLRWVVIVLVGAATAWFAYRASHLELQTRFDELLPQDHPFLAVHREHAKTFGGANTVLVMIEVEDGTIFEVETLQKIFEITQILDSTYGVNHYQIESIAHRTNRTLNVGAGGLMEMVPVMRGMPETEEDAARIRRIVHKSPNLYGVLVSIDNRRALLRASFIEGRLDHERLFREIREKIVEPYDDERTNVYVAGEPILYGWVYRHTAQAYWILGATILLAWGLLWLYFRDWRGALRPTLSGAIAALWGLGFIELLGFSLDPLTLVIPFFITARAVSHSAQMHERYYEEYERSDWDQHTAIVRAFAALFVPTLSGILTDALGVLAIFLVPIELLQKLALSASFWIAAIAVSELLLNPVIYSLLAPPAPEIVRARREGLFQRLVEGAGDLLVRPLARHVVVVAWVALLVGSAFFWTRLVIGDPEAVTPLLERDAPYNEAHAAIQRSFGGVEPLIVVVEAEQPGALRLPHNVKTVEDFQRFMERDPAIGASFSFVDVITTMHAAIHEWEYKWGVIPSQPSTVSMLFGAFFMGTAYEETARFMDPDFSSSAVFFYATDHRGPTVDRVIERAQRFVAENPLEQARFELAGGLLGVLAAANEELLRNDILLNLVGYLTIFLIVSLTYRSVVAGLILVSPLVVANAVVNAYMGARGIGINVQTLPVVTVGIGFGIDFAFYLVSRTREEILRSVGVEDAVRESIRTAGKPITFTAFTMIAGVAFWLFSDIRFNSEMGLLLAIWMATSFLASMTLLPALLLIFRPRFVTRA